MNTGELERDQTEYATRWYLPVTLAELEAAGVEVEGGFGIDEEERAQLLTEEGIVRLVVGVATDGEDVWREIDVAGLSVDGSDVALASDLGRDIRASWHRASRVYHDTSGARARTKQAQNERRMWDLAEARVVDLEAVLAAEEMAFEAAVDELNEESLLPHPDSGGAS